MLRHVPLQHRLQEVGVDAQFGRHQRRHPRRPQEPAVALPPRQAEHQVRGERPIDEFAPELADLDPPLFRLEEFMRGARFQVRCGVCSARNVSSFCISAFALRTGSVASALRTSLAAASIEPSGWSTRRPERRAFWTAPREIPAWAA